MTARTAVGREDLTHATTTYGEPMPQTLQRRQGELEAPNEDISETRVLAAAEIPGDRLVSINIEATADASYAIDVSAEPEPDADGWFEGEVVYDQADEPDPQDIRDVFELGDRTLRVRVTDPAAAGETADVTIQVA